MLIEINKPTQFNTRNEFTSVASITQDRSGSTKTKSSFQKKFKNFSFVHSTSVIKQLSRLFANPVDYKIYSLTKNPDLHDDNNSNELIKMTRKIAIHMEHQSFNRKDPVAIVVVLLEFMTKCDVYRIHGETALWLFKQYLSGSVKFVIQARFVLAAVNIGA